MDRLYKILIGIISLGLLIASNNLLANTFEISKIPYQMEGDWQLCVQDDQRSTTKCLTHPVPANIELAFPEFDGYLIYRSHFTVTEKLAKQPLGLYIESIRDADKVYINGTLIGETGNFPPDFEKANLHSRHYLIPSHIISFIEKNSIEIVAYNDSRFGGIVESAPILDSAENVSGKLLGKQSFFMFYLGIFLIISLIQFFYYFSQKYHKEHLYFAIFGLFTIIHLYTFSNTPVLLGANLSSNFNLNIFMFAMLSITFFLFINAFFHRRINLFFKLILSLLLISSIIQVTLLPIKYIYFQVTLIQIILLLILGPYYFWIFYISIKQEITYAKIMGLVATLHILAAASDILIDVQLLPPLASEITGIIAPITLLILFITIGLILTHRHWHYYRHATYDFLTGALRRSAFMDRLSQEISRSKRQNESLMLALLDIDDFKLINDLQNHSIGDKVLIEIVKTVRSHLREFDLIGRYGGDEFCIAASVSDTSHALTLLKRIIKNINSEPIFISENQSIKVSLTIGAFVAPPDSNLTNESLITEADKILVKGKINQKGKVHI